MELLADKELIENVKRLVNSEEDRGINNNDIVQQGGYVFGLIPAMGRLFAAAVKAIGNMFVALYPILFKWILAFDKASVSISIKATFPFISSIASAN